MSFKTTALSTALFMSLSALSLNAMAAPSAEVTLQGILTNTTCDVTINGGKSVLNVGVLKTSVGAGSDFAAVNTMSSTTAEMPVTLVGCAEGEEGNLIIQGITSVGNNEQDIFVATDSQTVGFMIEDEANNRITNGNGAKVEIGAGKTAAQYTFKVGMATTTDTPEAGSYSAPILVAYIVD
ncbi:type 1 fimbrial protein [Providencia sp. JGM181]|jgi:type 1 fimbria pilin|uniref:fimbrial protein n=1 Tax=unclassified Providencia TaxID=2633465 RepID=UPI001BA84520|nr:MULTISPECIES: type 1 fimbrial protein [unclassified Providencia]MBS0926227.1 type 1 fimbrial protein [Providencia sp. JGM181]MBS0934253.1 type 1 fimbrial protein [Providencia sp. JGM172]MBS0998064.1 type 1 fimbrial protein [Providencia sp. JGM178]